MRHPVLKFREKFRQEDGQLFYTWEFLNSYGNYLSLQLFCGTFELALKGHDEIKNSENRGIFKELVNFSAELDNNLKVHIQSPKYFKGILKTTQNELLEGVLDVYHEKIKKEIENISLCCSACR
ncbi:unnamed protein product [Diabrotica balteata]|uniref:Uncharacterized protein n=1 Tax=Diabrotica balteata TaxID=107213 RepID=A0A9N9X8C4_DIABA|nr:unnamed protein product [Diabrotica balteata]